MQLQQQAEIGLLTFVNFCLHSLTINKQTIIDRAATVPCNLHDANMDYVN